MSGPFDAYQQWLGIPPAEQPADYYQLLGLTRFESDRQKIAAAANQRLKLVESHLEGPHREAGSALQKELRQAGKLLLDPAKKTAYDAQLSSQPARAAQNAKSAIQKTNPASVGSGPRSPRPAKPIAAAPVSAAAKPIRPILVQATPHADSSTASVEGAPALKIETAPVSLASGRAPRRSQTTYVFGGLAVSLIGLGVLFASGALSKNTPPAESGPTVAVLPTNPSSSAPSANRGSGPELEPSSETPATPEGGNAPVIVTVTPPAVPAENPAESESTSPSTTSPETSDPPGENQATPAGPPGRSGLEELLEQAERGGQGGSPPPARQGRLAPPSEAAQQAARQMIDEIFAKELELAASDKKQKQELAKTFFAQARESGDDAAAQFVLYERAAQLVTDVGQFVSAWQIYDEMEQRFEFDTLSAKEESLDRSARLAEQPAHFRVVAARWRELADAAVEREQFALATRSATRALAAARRARDAALRKTMEDWERQIKDLAALGQEAEAAKAVLAADPDNAAAATHYGLFCCVQRDDWAKGLPLLAKGDDSELRLIAERDLAQPKIDADQLALADQWWDLAEASESPRRQAFRNRAAHWYQKALPQLTGLAHAKAEKRITDAATPPTTPGESPWIDVLKLVDVDKHGNPGFWRRAGSTIGNTTEISHNRIFFYFPVVIDDSYEFRCTVTVSNNDAQPRESPGLVFYMPAGDKRLAWRASAGAASLYIDGHQNTPNNPAYIATDRLTANRDHELRFRVQPIADELNIVVFLDNQPYFAWQGNSARLTPPPSMLPNDKLLSIGVGWSSLIQVKSAELRLDSGRPPLSFP